MTDSQILRLIQSLETGINKVASDLAGLSTRAAPWDSTLLTVGGANRDVELPTSPGTGTGVYICIVQTAVPGVTVELRTATGGGGSLVVGPFDCSLASLVSVSDGSSPTSAGIPTHARTNSDGLGVQFRFLRL